MIDYKKAQRVFEKYLDKYDREDDKVNLKIVHTYGVVNCSEKIAVRMGLLKEDIELAKLIALLHDIGRFEQLKRFDSFEPDTMDHAHYGVKVLFEEGMIEQFPIEKENYSIIRNAILKHSDFELEGLEEERELLHARLIRDSDKLDNCRVKLEEKIETMLGVPAKIVGSSPVSNEVFEECMKQRSILASIRKTKMDHWVSYMAYFFDINYKETMMFIKEQNYIERLIDRIPYKDEETKKRMEAIKNLLEGYIKTNCFKDYQAL